MVVEEVVVVKEVVVVEEVVVEEMKVKEEEMVEGVPCWDRSTGLMFAGQRLWRQLPSGL